MYDFEADGEDGLTVKEGEKLTVLDKEESDDWWKCRNSKGKEGVVPASYLETRVVEPNATLQPALPPDPVSELSSSSAGSPEPTFSKFGKEDSLSCRPIPLTQSATFNVLRYNDSY